MLQSSPTIQSSSVTKGTDEYREQSSGLIQYRWTHTNPDIRDRNIIVFFMTSPSEQILEWLGH